MLVSLFLYFMILPFYVILNSILLIVSLIRISSGNIGAWEVTTRDSATTESNNGWLRAPLLSQRVQGTSWVLVVGYVVMSAGCGSIIGALVGSHQVVQPLWGWVPFGIGATTKEVIDGRCVALGFCAGTCLGLIAPMLIYA